VGMGSNPDRLGTTFQRVRERNEAALVAYAMAGDPSVAASKTMLQACVDGGADIIEIGMPFSDPIADGPTVQKASERSLAAGTNLKDCLAVARELRRRSQVPLVFMGYVNPVLSFGLKPFLTAAADIGVDACIFPDLPPEEAETYCALAREHGIKTVFLLAPTSTPERYDQVLRMTTGFVYFVSVTGVTGARTALPEELTSQLDALRKRAEVPVAVGFGIAEPKQVSALSAHADAVVVGSAIVSRIAAPGTLAVRKKRLTTFVRSLKKGTGRAPHGG
jgi:tryptophan synthase alpha chain